MIYKEKAKLLHDIHILRKEIHVGDKVMRFKARYAFKPGKLAARWDGPYVVTKIHDYGTIELMDEVDGIAFQVNGYLLKLFKENFKPL